MICSNAFGRVIRCSRRRHTLPPVPPPGDLDQTTLSDVRMVSPSGELDETYFSFWPIPSVIWNYDVIHNIGSS